MLIGPGLQIRSEYCGASAALLVVRRPCVLKDLSFPVVYTCTSCSFCAHLA
jgi:hypothetical protein